MVHRILRLNYPSLIFVPDKKNMADGITSELQTPTFIIENSEYAKQDGWDVDDISLCLSGSIAISGHRGYQSFVCVYGSTFDNSDSIDRPTLLFHKQFNQKTHRPIQRYVSFIKPNSTEIVTCLRDEVQVIDYNRVVVLRSRHVNGTIWRLSVSERQIFIGVRWSDVVNIYDIDLNRIKLIRLKGIMSDWLRDTSAAADKFYVCTGYRRAIVYSQESGSILTEYTTGQEDSNAWSIAASTELGLTAVLWYQGVTSQKQIIFYLLSENKSVLTLNVESTVSRIRISDQGKVVTGNETTGEVKIYDLHISYDTLKQAWQSMLHKDDCKSLSNHFNLPKDQTDAIIVSNTPVRDLLLALEERDIIYPSNVSRLREAFFALQTNENYYGVAKIYNDNASANAYDRFLVTLSAHLTASLAGNLCIEFNISDDMKNYITSNPNPGLSLLLALNDTGKINQSSVHALEQPFTNLRLVQAVAKIQEYQSLIDAERNLFQKTTVLTKEGKKQLIINLLRRKIKSWYEGMTPVPWKMSCQWKSSELFVGSGLILTNSKTRRSMKDVDERCKLKYTDILSHESLENETRVIIEGEPGSGKTMLSSQLAYDWSQNKISDINAFILLPLKFVKKTIVKAIEEFYAMEGMGLSLNDIEDTIIAEGGKCCFLLDGLEEYNGEDGTSAEELSEVMKIMTRSKYPNCKVILTSRSDYIHDLPPYPVLKLGAFGEIQRHSYIEKVFSDDYEKQLKIKNVIDDTPFIPDLFSVPLLFVLAVHNIESIAYVQEVWHDRVSPFIGKIVETMCPLVRREDTGEAQQSYSDDSEYIQYDIDFDVYSFDRSFSDTEISLEMLAFNGLCRGKQQLSWQKRFVEENVGNVKEYLDSGILVVEENVNVGKLVEKTAQKVTDPRQAGKVWIEGNGNISGIKDFPKDTVYNSFKEEGSKYKKESSVMVKSTLHGNRSSNVEPTEQVESGLGGYLQSPLNIQHVSLQVKFVHKILQEWFAARYLTDIFFKYGNLPLLKKYKLLKEHLEQINPADLHYVLRFTCALCPTGCPLILNYLFSTYRSEEGKIPGHIMNCICLCLAEYEGHGYKGHYIKDVISQVCKADITIHSEDNMLLQRAKVSMLQLASKSKLPISRLNLTEVVVQASEDELKFNSGATLKILTTLEKIEMSRWDHRLMEMDYINITKFVIGSAAMKKAILIFPSQPPELKNVTLKGKTSKKVSVEWHIGKLVVWTLDLSNRKWTNETALRGAAQRQLADEKQMQQYSTSCLPGTSADYGTEVSKSQGAQEQTKRDSIPEAAVTEQLLKVFKEGTCFGGVSRSQLTDCYYLLETKATITKNGGVLEIPNTNVTLMMPSDCLPEGMEQCEMHLRIIPRDIIKEQVSLPSSNSSIVVELLPDSLKFRQPVRLTIPHCWVLQDTGERKARIYISHHETESVPQWEEQTNISYHLEDTACIILLNSFCLVKFSVDDEIVEAIKLIVYTAARKLQPVDNVAEIHVGYYWDLPDEKMVAQCVRDLTVARRKTFFFVRKKEKKPLRVSLDNVFPSNWQNHSKSSRAREMAYTQVVSVSRKTVIYTLEKDGNIPGNPLCVFTVSQESGQIAVQLAANLKVTDKELLPTGNLESAVTMGQCGAPMKAEMTVTNAGGTLTINSSEVKLEIPPDAIPSDRKECLIRITINPARVVEDKVTPFCANSCTAVDIFPSNLRLSCPAILTLPHCLKLMKKEGLKATIFFNEEEGSPSLWREQQNLQHELNDSSCIMHLEKLCCVKYSIEESIVEGKRIMLYTAAQSVKQKDRLADADVGYYSDVPGGGELLQLNPNLQIDSETEVLFIEKPKFGLKLSLECVVPSAWKHCIPDQNPQEIPYSVIASSIEHSHLYVLQKETDYPGSVICKFIASQENSHMSSELSLRICPQRDQPKDKNQAQQQVTKVDPMTVTFTFLSKHLLVEEWKFVGKELGLKDAELDHIAHDYTATKERIYEMLVLWKRKYGKGATLAKLIRSLEKTENKDLAERLLNRKDLEDW